MEYVFDDNTEFGKAGPVSIDEAMARAIVTDFKEHKDNVEALLVHCTRGIN